MRTVLAVMVMILVGGVTIASAQRARAPSIQRNQEIFRAPPRSPAARPDRLPPSEIGRPRERIEPLPEMKPRVGN
jgi:hypothetical protein